MEITPADSATDAAIANHSSGTRRYGEMEDIMKIAKSFEQSALLINGVGQTIE